MVNIISLGRIDVMIFFHDNFVEQSQTIQKNVKLKVCFFSMPPTRILKFLQCVILICYAVCQLRSHYIGVCYSCFSLAVPVYLQQYAYKIFVNTTLYLFVSCRGVVKHSFIIC